MGTPEQWHKRAGHPVPDALYHLVRSVVGVKMTGRGHVTVECDACGVLTVLNGASKKNVP